MKHKLKLSDIGRNTYFHHDNGVVIRKKLSIVATLYASTLLVIGGGFFITYSYALPVIKKNIKNFQNQQPVQTASVVGLEPKSDENVRPEIQKENEILSGLLKDKLATYSKGQNWSVMMYDLQEGSSVNINTDRTFGASSLYKLFLLEALEEKLPFDKWSKTKLPDRTTIQKCVEDMLKNTDSACAEDLGGFIGWDKVDELNAKNGYIGTKLTGTDGRKTTAKDVGELLTRLKKGEVLSDKARRFVFDALYQQVNTRGITVGCNGCRAADKLGEASGIAHDAGIVTHGDKSYVVVLMSEGGNFDQIAELTKLIESNR